MEYLNIWEKLNLLFELINNNCFFVAFLIIDAIIIAINRLRLITNKKTLLIIALSSVLLFSIILFNNNEVLFKTFDSISNLIFKNIYFPSIYVYLAIILISDIILIISLLSKNITKIYKNINIIVTFIINFIFIVLLNTIGKENIDILSVENLYTNSHIVSMIELTTSLFIIWLISILLIAIINTILLLIENKKMDTEPIISISKIIDSIELEVPEKEEPKLSNLEIYPLNHLNNNIVPNINIDIKPIPEKVTNTIEIPKQEQTALVFNDFVKKDNNILNNIKQQSNSIDNLMNLKPIMPSQESTINEIAIKEEPLKVVESPNIIELKVEEPISKTTPKYTKEDYQLFNNILKVVKESNNNKEYVTMDDALSINLLNKFSIKEYNLYKKMLEEVK